jgi:RHS repeat-associated protein
MKQNNILTLSTSPQTNPARKPRLTTRFLYRSTRRRYTGKEQDSETGLYYYGARYLDSRTGRWLSGDPAVSEYIPSAPVNEEAKKRNGSLPGMGGVFNYANLHVYHYAGNNPVKYTDPDGEYAEVSVKGKSVNIVVPVVFLNGSRKEREQFVRAAEQTWSGQFGDYNVTLKIEERDPSQGRVNTVKWEDMANDNSLGSVSGGKEMTLYRKVRRGGLLTGLGGFGRFDVINASDIYNTDQAIAHEVGHLMNLPHNKDDQNIMRKETFENSETFSVNQKNIEDIIEKN